MRKLAILLIFAALLLLALLLASPFPVKLVLTEPGRVYAFLVSEPSLSLPVPVEGVKPRQLADTWGGARSGGRKHEGIDIFAKRNTPVTSTTDGIVTFIGQNTLGGRTIWILAPGRERHYYAHLESYATDLHEGDFISAGRVIGYVGDSGNARGTPPHLHFGIYGLSSGATNPYPRLTVKSRE